MKYKVATIRLVIILIIVAFFLKLVIMYFSPILIAFIVSILLQPIITLIQKLGIRKNISIIIAYILFIFMLITFGSIILNSLYLIITSFIHNIPDVIRMISEIDIFKNNMLNIYETISSINNYIMQFKDKIFSLLLSSIGSVSQLLIITVMALLFSYDIDKIKNIESNLIPFEYKYIFKKIFLSVKGIFLMQLELVFISLIIVTICFFILGVKNAFVLGVLCALLDILPILGPALVFLPLIMYKFIEGNYFAGFGLILVYVLNCLIRQIIEVKLFNTRFNFSPIMTIISLYVGYVIYGYWGLLIGPIFYLIITEVINLKFQKIIDTNVE